MDRTWVFDTQDASSSLARGTKINIPVAQLNRAQGFSKPKVKGSNPFGCTKLKMMINNLQTIYADTWDKLTLKMLGYHHDHCWHHYIGLTIDIPNKWKYLIKENKNYKFVFVYEEDTPIDIL